MPDLDLDARVAARLSELHNGATPVPQAYESAAPVPRGFGRKGV